MSSSIFMTFLSVSGPIVAAIGALMLAYDTLQGPMRVHNQRAFQKQVRSVLWKHQYLSLSYPNPPYTVEEITEMKKQLDAERDESLARIEAEVTDSELKYRLLVSNLGFLGFLLVAIGSLAQGIAAWLAA